MFNAVSSYVSIIDCVLFYRQTNPTAEVMCCRFSDDGALFAVGLSNGQVKVRAMTTNAMNNDIHQQLNNIL